MRAKRTKFGLLIALIYLLGLEGYTLVNKEPNDTISEVFQEWGYEYPVLIVGAWFLLAGHWWWRIGGKQRISDNKSLTPLPDDIVVYNGGVRCDTAIGPCSCGATHTLEELKSRINQNPPKEAINARE